MFRIIPFFLQIHVLVVMLFYEFFIVLNVRTYHVVIKLDLLAW